MIVAKQQSNYQENYKTAKTGNTDQKYEFFEDNRVECPLDTYKRKSIDGRTPARKKCVTRW